MKLFQTQDEQIEQTSEISFSVFYVKVENNTEIFTLKTKTSLFI